jgi:predicted MFS family arabinose efflux permease
MNPAPTARQEWKSGWTLVLASSFGFSFFTIMLSSSGLFMGPIEDEFHWSRTLLSAGVSIGATTTAILSPFFGILIDRYGSRRLVLPGIVLTMGSILSFSLVNGEPWQWIGLWLLFGFCATTIKSTAWTAAVLGVFEQSKGLALALTLTGSAASQVIVPPLGNWLITEFGWRSAYVWMALGWGGITLVLCFLFFYDIHDKRAGKGRRGHSEPAETTERAPKPELPGLTPRKAIRNSALQRIAFSHFTVMVLTMGLSVHLFLILTDAGISRAHAAWLSSLGGVAGIVGKLLTGFLLDRFRPNWIGGITLGVAAVMFASLMDGVRSVPLITLAMIVNGYTAGTKTQITGYLTASYAGMKSFGVIYGTMAALMALATGVGPVLAGWVYDTWGGYGPYLLVGAIGCAVAGAINVSLPPYPKWPKEGASAIAL